MEHLTASVIICTRNRLPDLKKFLTSLAMQTQQPKQLIIVDSSDQPLTTSAEFLLQFNVQQFPATELIYLHTQPGLTLQRNKGIKHATEQITYFFDDDVILTPQYLEKMMSIFKTRPDFAGGMGSITNMASYKNNFFRLQRKLFLLQRDYGNGHFTLSGMPTHTYGQQQFQSVSVVGGCCMAFRTNLLQEYTFDENLPHYAALEDVDFSWRISRNHKLFYNPAARLEHHNSPLNRDKLYASHAMYMRHYRYHFFKNVYPKNKFVLIAHWWSIMGLCIEALVFERTITSLRGYLHGLLTPLKLTPTYKKFSLILTILSFSSLVGMESFPNIKLSTLDDVPVYYAQLAYQVTQQPGKRSPFSPIRYKILKVEDWNDCRITDILTSNTRTRESLALHYYGIGNSQDHGLMLHIHGKECSLKETQQSYAKAIKCLKTGWRSRGKTEDQYVLIKKQQLEEEGILLQFLINKFELHDKMLVNSAMENTVVLGIQKNTFSEFEEIFNFDCTRLAKARAKIIWVLTKAIQKDGAPLFPFPKEIKQLIVMLAYPYSSELF